MPERRPEAKEVELATFSIREEKEIKTPTDAKQFEDNANALIHNMKYLFIQIPEEEFKRTKNTPHYVAATSAFNQLNYSVQENILAGQSIEERAVAIAGWIQRMKKCFEDGDHLSALAIQQALASDPISNLKKTKEILSKENQSILAEYTELFSSQKNNQNYKNKLSTIPLDEKPVVPCFGFILGNLREAYGQSVAVKEETNQIFESVLRMQKTCQRMYPSEVMPVLLQIDSYDDNRKNKSRQLEDPRLEDVLVAGLVQKNDKKREDAIDSLFDIVAPMEQKAKLAFFRALITLTNADNKLYEDLKTQYEKLVPDIKKSEKEKIKNEISALELQIKKHAKTIKNIPESEWYKLIRAIPKPDAPKNTDIFRRPVCKVNSNHPKHEDIRHDMSRDLRDYRFIAPKGESGAQDSGPLGGWYIGCYQTPDGRIHTQRFMVKREGQFCKNIIESICGRLKSSLVNIDQDYAAATYLVHKSDETPTGENTYAVSIAFDEFKENHVDVPGLTTSRRIKMAGTKKKIFDGNARKIFSHIEHLHDEGYKGLEEGLLAAWWTGDNDVHTGNIGRGLGRFLSIDHAGGMMELAYKIHPERDGLFQNVLRVLRRHPEPTYHAAEYSAELRNSQMMVDVIKRCTHRMTATKIKEIINDEVAQAVTHYRDDLKTFKEFAIRASVPEDFLRDKDIDACAEITKNHLYKLMYARLVNLRQFGNEIELSLCFEYKKGVLPFSKMEFVLKDPQKLARFIQENPNFSLYERHHFRGNEEVPFLSTEHQRISAGFQLEELLAKEREKILGRNNAALPQKNNFDLKPLMAKDFHVPALLDRAESYSTRLRIIQQICENEHINTHRFKNKIDELLEFLTVFRSGISQQHLTQVCDDAYNTIQRIYETFNYDNPEERLAKIKIYEIFHKLYEDETLLKKYNETTKNISPHISDAEIKKNAAIQAQLQLDFQGFSVEHSAFMQLEKKEALFSLTHHVLQNEDQKSFLEQAQDFFKQPPTATVVGQVSPVEEIKPDDRAVLLENPTTGAKSGALMFIQNGETKIYDFENPNISAANILAELLKHYTNDETNSGKEKLREFIQENYIDVLQNKIPPELIDKNNLQKKLFPLLVQHFEFKPPSSISFFKQTDTFVERVFKQFEELTAWNPELVKWTQLLEKTLESKGHRPEDMYVENAHGNTEFARLFLILIYVKSGEPEDLAAFLKKANRTGYSFTITETDISRMRDIIYPEKRFEIPRELVRLLDQIEGHLRQALPETKTELDEMKNRFESDQTQLMALQKRDTTGQYMQLYSTIPEKLAAKIESIDAQTKKIVTPSIMERS